MTSSKYKNVQAEADVAVLPMGAVEQILRFSKALFGSRTYSISMSTAQDKGRRDYQEDAVLAGTVDNSDISVCVLADGMGGHANGGTASTVVSQLIFERLLDQLTSNSKTKEIRELLFECTNKANEEIAKHVQNNNLEDGMGTTLVAMVVKDNELFWVSVGDSPLYLFRNGNLEQLNEDHSMAPQIDELVQMGIITEDSAEKHMDRNRLTSALMGDEISRIDLPDTPKALLPKDIVVLSSDGLQFLPDAEISRILKEKANKTANEITKSLMNEVLALRDPTQDNIGICTTRFQKAKG